MARRSLGKPRFYADIPQYLKALGYYDGSDTPEVWNMNPVQSTEHETVGMYSSLNFNINNPSKELDQLITNVPQASSSGIYGAVLGHNLKEVLIAFQAGDYTFDETTEIVNYSSLSPEYNGYSIWDITDCGNEENIDKIIFSILGSGIRKIGAISFGRWFEPEYSFDLKGTISNNYEGIKLQSTVGGNTLSNINHLGQPNWGDLPAWTLEKRNGADYNIGGAKGRRSWKVGFSFLSDDKIFNKAGNPDKFFTYDEDTEQYTFDTSLASFLKLTFNGKLPFIFCPDSSATDLEFALCRITNQLSFSQVANNLFSTSLTIMETY